jgi:8-oxo-dGTP pyrophosphatase MutT (NUDIX family)
MSYIQELRKCVGNRPLIMVGAAVLVMDQEDRLLLLLRTDNGLWGLPGGAMEPGERLEETAKRETKEETGLDVEQLILFDVFSGPELFYRYPNGAEVYNVTVVYQTNRVRGNLELCPEEHITYQYFNIEHLPKEVSPPIKPVLEELVKRHTTQWCSGPRAKS